MATVGPERANLLTALGAFCARGVIALGDFAVFSNQTLGWLLARRSSTRTLLPVFYAVGVRSVPVVAVTGMFIGMVMAVQFFKQFDNIGMGTRLGAIINISIVRELGPVLAATMLAGRVGSAIAAELATMRITEQIDALSALGASPLHHLVVPRLLACVLLIPLLTVLANYMGIMGGAFITTRLYGVEPHYYWEHSRQFVGLWDLFTGIVKAMVFGALIALISCHCGLNSQPGAEGVGRAATEAFVTSFVVILIADFFLGMFLLSAYDYLWPGVKKTLV